MCIILKVSSAAGGVWAPLLPECPRPLANMIAPSSSFSTHHTFSLSALAPKAHRSSLSHAVTYDNQQRDYGDQINYDLIQNAMVPPLQ